MSEWKTIGSAPAVGKKRLLFRLADKRMVVGYRIAQSQFVRPEDAVSTVQATHWMPIPPPPSTT